MQGWINTHTTIKTIHHINRLNKKKYVHINNAEKLNICHALVLNTLEKLAVEVDVLSLIKEIYEKLTDNMKFNGKK